MKTYTHTQGYIFTLIFCTTVLIGVLSGCNMRPNTDFVAAVDSLEQQFENPSKRNYVVQTLQKRIPSLADLPNAVAAKKYNILANYFHKIHRNSYLAYLYSDSALKAIEHEPENNKDLFLAISLRHSNILFELNKTDEGFESFFRSKRLIEENFDSCYLLKFYDKISFGLYSNRKYVQAIKYYNQSLDLVKTCTLLGDREVMFQMQGNYDNIALCYERLGQYAKADSCYRLALTYVQEFQKLHPADTGTVKNRLVMCESVILGNLGSNLLNSNAYDSATYFLRQSLDLSRDNKDLAIDHQFNLIKLATAYLKLNEPRKSDSLVGVLNKQMAVFTDYDVQVRLKNLMWQYYGKTGDYKKAYATRDEYQVYKDSLHNALLLQANEVDFETELNNTGNRITVYELNKKNGQITIWMAFLGAILIMTIFVVLLIRKNQLLLKEGFQNQRQLNEQIVDQNKQLANNLTLLELTQQENNKTIKVLSHDLRTPIVSMNGLMSLLKDDPSITASQLSIVTLAQQTSNDALLLIENLLEGHASFNGDIKIPVKVHELIAYCVDMLQPKASNKEITLLNLVQPTTLYIHRQKVWRVISNLLTNAIKFSHIGGVVKVASETSSTHIVITVNDKGIGIPKEMLDTLFDKGVEHNRTGTAGEVSYGLGLPIAKDIVEAHNGRLWVESNQEAGTTFFIEFPLQKFS